MFKRYRWSDHSEEYFKLEELSDIPSKSVLNSSTGILATGTNIFISSKAVYGKDGRGFWKMYAVPKTEKNMKKLESIYGAPKRGGSGAFFEEIVPTLKSQKKKFNIGRKSYGVRKKR